MPVPRQTAARRTEAVMIALFSPEHARATRTTYIQVQNRIERYRYFMKYDISIPAEEVPADEEIHCGTLGHHDIPSPRN